MLKFSNANAKTEALKEVEELKPFLADKRKIYSFDLLSGYSCPVANECLSKAVADENGKRTIQDGLKLNSVVSLLVKRYSIPTSITYASTISIRCVVCILTI